MQAAKPAYLSTEGITALSNIINSGTQLQGGNLHLQVSTAVGSQKQKSWTSQFDFQQGVRDGVDTYGMNDWLIPDDYFELDTVDANRWETFGKVSVISGKVVLDGSEATAGLKSRWQLEGDFDVQVDFENFNSFREKGAEIIVRNNNFYMFLYNTTWGYYTGVNIGGSNFGGIWSGNLAPNGKFRLIRTGQTITTYYLDGTTWKQHYSATHKVLSENIGITLDLWSGYVSNNTFVYYDNFKVNSGRIVTKNEAVDSVRLLQMNDNFDDGVFNADRWSVRSTGSTTTNEANGNFVTKDTQTGVQSYSNVASRFPLEGDFDISIDWKTPVAPSSGDWGSIFQINEVDQNTAPDNNLTGNALQIKRAYINGLGHVYQTGHYNGATWDSWSSPVTTTDIPGKFRIKRSGSLVTVWYWNNSLNRWEWNGDTAGYAWSGVWTTPFFVQFGTANNAPDNPATETSWNNFKASNSAAYLGKGTIRLKQNAGQTSNWQTISWNSTEPIGTSVKFRARTAENEGDLTNAPWVDYVTSGSPITNPKGRWIELEATLATTNTSVTPLLNDVTVTYGSSQGDILWQADVPLSLAQGAVSDFTNTVGTLGNAGKYYLQGTVTSTSGQTVTAYEYPFFVAQGNTALSFLPGKRIYKPGETVTITGEVRNLATVEAANLSLLLKGKPSGGVEQALLTEAFTIPAGGSHPFTVTTTSGMDGVVTLTGVVTQNSSTLAEITDQYEVATPKPAATLTVPDTAGNDLFTMGLQLTNSGKTDATVTVGKSFSSLSETVTIPAGQTRLLQYPQQISADTTYTFTLSGDLTQTVSKTVKYGLAGNITITPQALYPEGKIAIPATITNSGLLDGQFGVSWQLTQAATLLNQQAATHYIAKGGNAADTLSHNLTEGSYQLSASGQLPALAATTNFVVRKEIKADLTQTIGTQNGASLPVSATVTNLGYNAISGVVRLSLLNAQGVAVWNAGQDVNLPQSLVPAPQTLTFTINLSAVKLGDYTIKAELLDTANKQLATQSAPFTLLAPIFALTQTPPYQTFQPGANGTFIFKIKNSGNREGACTLAFKAGDLSDSSRTEWLKPGEEKELSFTTTLPVDLDEKDYTAAYRLTGNGITLAEDVVRYRLSGINLNVTASLDRQQYRPGESATFTLTVDQPAGTAPLEMFARVHYNSYDEKRSFTLSGAQTLTFTVPLPAITGEKLFYGIYHQSGRSIHLNTMYVNAANDQLAISSDKQVYNPGETVAVTVRGSVAGDLLLTGPGGFSTTIAFNGSASSSLTLPDNLTSGTYKLAATVTTATGARVTAERPIDVAGLKVTLREARLDKAVYAATDTMKLTLTAESSQNLPALLKTWIVDPGGTYSEAGESSVTLNSSTPVVLTQGAALATTTMGIHKLVYGIYRGNDLIASGAKAFDIGDALVTAVSTDKREYAGISEPVSVKVELFGTATGELALQLDGIIVQTASVTLNGFGTQTLVLPAASVAAGRHAIKALLTSGGLTSARETEFIFGSALPDLTARLTVQAPKGPESVVTATVVNQGKSSAGASSLTLYDGDPPTGGTVIAVLSVPALDAGASVTVSYSWSVLGKAGDHLVYAVADSGNVVTEFDERNNSARASIAFPAVLLSVTTGSTSYNANEEASLTVALANLSPSIAYADAAVELTLTDPAGVISILAVKPLPLQAAYATTFVTSWNSASHLPGGYLLNGRLLSGTSELASQELAFTVNPTVSMSGAITAAKDEIFPGAALDVSVTVTNNGNVDIGNGEVLLELIDKTSGTAAQSLTQALDSLAVLQKLTPAVSLNKVEAPAGEYLLRVTGLVAGVRFSLGEQPLKVLPSLEITHDLDHAPRVLVFVDKSSDTNDGNNKGDATGKDGDENKHSSRAELLIRQALTAGGDAYAVTDNNDTFKRALRSGLYNTFLLAGSQPLTDHLDSELGERVNAGDGLILFGYDKLADVKMRDLAGVHPYGSGKVVSLASDSSALLPDALASVAPVQVESVPGVPLTVTIALKSLGASFDVRVTESVPSALPLLSTRPAGTVDQHQISWPVTIAKDGMVTLAYTVGLPENGGSYEASTDVAFSRNGAYETYKKISHSVGSSRSVADIGSDILGSLKSVQAGGKNADELREAVRKFERFLTMPGFSAQQLDKAIELLLDVVQELQEMAVDTDTIRLDIDRLLKAYGRKWLESAL